MCSAVEDVMLILMSLMTALLFLSDMYIPYVTAISRVYCSRKSICRKIDSNTVSQSHSAVPLVYVNYTGNPTSMKVIVCNLSCVQKCSL